ncbi:MAG: electron transfer flavoprotein subunit alpha/FixB family protein [Thermoleophilia bacterium]|nr:electron transfer flavoprotein subunit alpha/FixB family protein [Thermoleophilia bacterium]
MNLCLVEHLDGVATDASLQAFTLAAGLGGETHALVIGPGGAEVAATIPAAVVYVAEHDALDAFAPDAWAAILCAMPSRTGVTAIVAPGSARATDAMARAAVRLGEPLAANCISATPGNPLLLTRIRWGGSLLEEARLHTDCALLTVVPHTLPAVAPGSPGAVERFTPELADADLVVRVRERVAPPAGGVSLTDAKVVVTGGRGVGSAEGFVVVEELAGLLGGAVGCSRAVTMSGWRPHTDQVGQTGNKIAPEIYIACGVSGATQHIAGAKGAKRILAVNTDPEAPIMSVADYAVVGDLHEVLPAISAELRRRRG